MHHPGDEVRALVFKALMQRRIEEITGVLLIAEYVIVEDVVDAVATSLRRPQLLIRLVIELLDAELASLVLLSSEPYLLVDSGDALPVILQLLRHLIKVSRLLASPFTIVGDLLFVPLEVAALHDLVHDWVEADEQR